MSRDHRPGYYNRDRDRDRDWNHGDYHRSGKRSRSRSRSNLDKRRSRTPRKSEKDIIDENILSEISKLPEPSELWDTQFHENNFSAPPPPPTFTTEAVPNAAYNSNYPNQYTGIYDEFNTISSAPPPPDMSVWNQMALPPPPQPPPAPVLNSEDQIKKEAAIESEMRHQKAALSKQREDYIKKAAILRKELDTLKGQRNELRGDAKRSPSPDTKRFLKENTKLQLEIQNKLKTITNVVDMLNGIIGEEAQVVISDSDEPVERTKRKSRSPTGNKFNYVYYDPEMHWCRVCNEFPPTAKDYLNHLHSPAHHKMAAAHMEAPWHSVAGVHEGFTNYPAAPSKRTPIRGLQFFVPSTAWYCKLCDQFIGDLHCASAHLKSILHSKNYTNFVEQNPHWETDWMSDRQKAVEKSRTSKKVERPEEKQAYTSHTITFHKDGFHTKNESPSRTPEKKKTKEKKRKSKRKRSSSVSSSSSSSSDSEPKKKRNRGKKEKHGQHTPDDKSLTEWVSNIQVDRLNDSDRKLLDSIKNRIKKDKLEEEEREKRRSPSRASRERERERSIADLQRRLRETERRDIRPHEERRRDERRDDRRDERRDERREERRDDRREERRDERREGRPPVGIKKPEVKKMPFIGKMPVFKNMVKPPNTKTDEQKKDDQKKKEDAAVTQKRQQEMDVEIQKKVAEFKQKIARAQLERQQQLELQAAQAAQAAQAMVMPPQQFLPPLCSAPTLATLPTPLTLPPPPHATVPTSTPQQPQPNLSKDFQDALDIIFPTGEVKNPELPGQEMFAMPPGFPLMPPFQPLGLMQPQMFGFDMNQQLFPPRPQLYDAHVPLVSSPKPRMQNKNNRQKDNLKDQKKIPPNTAKEIVKNKEELDDLAMLGIDASDVGAGI